MADKQPENNSGIFERIKKIFEPILWIIGIVTTLIAFYELWKGNQALVIYVFAGIVFLSLLIALGWVGFIKKETPKRGKRKVAKIPFHKDYPRIARIGFVLLIVLATYSLFQNRQAHEKYLAERENKLIVLITGFEGPEDVYGLRNEIIENLNADFSSDGNVEIISIDEIITLSKGSEYARELGGNYLADIVIWGWYRPTENPNVNIHIENLSPNQIFSLGESESFQPVTTLSELESFLFQQQVGNETSALVSFLAGLIEYRSENYEMAIGYFTDSLNTPPASSALFENQSEIFYYRGNSNVFLSNYEVAIQDYDKAIQLNPQYIEAYSNRGFAYASLGNYKNAIQDYDKVIQINPKDVEGFINRGNTYAELGQYERAIQDYDQVIKINPQNIIAYFNRGISYVDLGNYENAIQDYNKVIQINPQYAEAYNNRGNTYADLDEYERAIQDYNHAIQINPQYTRAYFNRGLAYALLESYERAIQDFTQAIQINPQYARAYYNRGLTYQALGKTAEAEADFAKYKELTGQDAP